MTQRWIPDNNKKWTYLEEMQEEEPNQGLSKNFVSHLNLPEMSDFI
jgi:hypothetical protein